MRQVSRYEHKQMSARFRSSEYYSWPYDFEREFSDRWQWDHAKAERLWKEHVGTRVEFAGSAKLSAFISAYHGAKYDVVALAEGCNIGTGYAYWIVWYVPSAQ